MMFQSKYRLCELFGIPIFVDISFAILLLIFATSQASISGGIAWALVLTVVLNYFTAYANLKESRYDWYFEFSDESVNQKRAEDFSEVVDAFLKETNIEYAAKRDSNRLKAPATFRLQKQSFDSFKEAILSRTRRDPSRFKPNVLAQNEERHDIISQFILKSGLKRKNRK